MLIAIEFASEVVFAARPLLGFDWQSAWAEGRAAQGCDRSADPGAKTEMGGDAVLNSSPPWSFAMDRPGTVIEAVNPAAANVAELNLGEFRGILK